MIIFEEDGTVTIDFFRRTIEEFHAWEVAGGGEPTQAAYVMKIPETAAGDALLSLCRIGNDEEDTFEALLKNILSEAFQAGIDSCQKK